MTRETKERIQYLLIQYLEEKASPDELERLTQYLTASPAPDNEVWMELMEELMITQPALAGYDPTAWQPFIDGLKQQNAARATHADTPAVPASPVNAALDPFPVTPSPAPRPVVAIHRIHFLRRSRWWAAAAILLLTGSAWLWTQRNRQSSPPLSKQETPQKDLMPGGNHAILTLAGGRQIILDSAANGLLTQQGNSRIQKLTNGQLAYQASPIDKSQPATNNQKPETFNTLSTPRGGQYQLTLPDNSRVWLNAASSITYPTAFTGKDRVVKITGEAYFEVTHNDRQPFRVQAGDQSIEDIGTSFNVNAYADEPGVRTTLVAGKVKVTNGTAVRMLTPGQQAQSRGNDLEMVPHADLAQALAWKNGAFAFRDADLSTVMRQLARWYDIDVEYEGPVPTGHFDGEIGRSLTLNQVLQGLANTRIHYTIVDNHKIIIRP